MIEAPPFQVYVALTLLAIIGWQSARMMRQHNYLILLTWPVFIYFIGPVATLLFVDRPVLSRYVDETRMLPQTLLITWYVAVMIFADKAVGMSAALRRSLDGAVLKKLSSRPLFPVIYIMSALTAAFLQVQTLATFGTIFGGAYVLEGVAEGLIPYWGFLAGLYEIVFLCFVLVLLGQRSERRIWLLYLALYVLTTTLRVIGGTRLILIKELAVVIIIFYMRGSIKPRQLLFAGAIVVVAGTVVGMLRTGVDSDAVGLLGPLYGLVMESALNALTLGIADQTSLSGVVARQGDILASMLFLMISVIPSFLRFGFTEADLAQINPYNLALTAGFDTSSPVGGMSGFATIHYLSSYPHLFILAMVFTFATWLKLARNSAFKQIISLVIVINAIHFWRDPADIAYKLLVQSLCICGFLYFSGRSRNKCKRLHSLDKSNEGFPPASALTGSEKLSESSNS